MPVKLFYWNMLYVSTKRKSAKKIFLGGVHGEQTPATLAKFDEFEKGFG
jgi:hypothetical protein